MKSPIIATMALLVRSFDGGSGLLLREMVRPPNQVQKTVLVGSVTFDGYILPCFMTDQLTFSSEN